MRNTSLLTLLLLTGCSSPQEQVEHPSAPPGEQEVAAPDGGPVSATDESEAIRSLVIESQVAGFVRHDLEAYIAPWADDSRLVIGRSEEPADADATWDRSHLEASRRMRFKAPPSGDSLRHEDVVIEVTGDSATLRCRTIASGEGWAEVMHELFRLRRTSQGWEIVENRAWPISRQSRGEELVYDAETWAQLDRAVDEALDRGDTEAAVNAAIMAFRFRDAFDTARDAASIGDALAYDHLRLGHVAVLIGDEQVALEAFREARRRDPEASVPSWALE